MNRSTHNLYPVYKLSDPLNSRFSQFRLQHGLHWEKSTPPVLPAITETLRITLYLLLILLAYGIVGTMDYADQAAHEAEVATDRAALHQAALLACLNGGSTGLYTIDDKGHKHYVVCGDSFTVSTENVRRPM